MLSLISVFTFIISWLLLVMGLVCIYLYFLVSVFFLPSLYARVSSIKVPFLFKEFLQPFFNIYWR